MALILIFSLPGSVAARGQSEIPSHDYSEAEVQRPHNGLPPQSSQDSGLTFEFIDNEDDITHDFIEDYYFGWPEGFCPYIYAGLICSGYVIEYDAGWQEAFAAQEAFATQLEDDDIEDYHFTWPEGFCPYIYAGLIPSGYVTEYDTGFCPETFGIFGIEGFALELDTDYEYVRYYGWPEGFCIEEFWAQGDPDPNVVIEYYFGWDTFVPDAFEAFDAMIDSDNVIEYYFGWPEGFCPDAHIAQAGYDYVIEFGYLWDDILGLNAFDLDRIDDYDEPMLMYYFGWDSDEPQIMTMEQFYSLIYPTLQAASYAFEPITQEDITQEPTVMYYFDWDSYELQSICMDLFYETIYPYLVAEANSPYNQGAVDIEPFSTGTLSLRPETWSPTSAANNVTIGITSNRTWSVSSTVTWLTISNIMPVNTTNDGSFRINVTANTTAGQRVGYAIVSSTQAPTRSVRVTQAGPAATLTLTTSGWSPGAAPTSSTVNVRSNTTWNVSSNASWLTVTNITPPHRTGDGSFRLNVTANPGTGTRSAVVTVTATGAPTRTVQVTQNPIPPSLYLNGSTWNPPSGASNAIIGVTANRTWSVSSNSTTWLTISNITNNTGNGSFRMNVSANTGTADRTGVVTVSVPGITRTVSVRQIPPAPILDLSTNTWRPTPAASNATVNVTSNRQWTATVSTNTPWLTITNINPQNRTGNGSFRMNVAANNGTTDRTGTITVTAPGATTRTIAVTQEATGRLVLSQSTWAPTSASSNATIRVESNRQWSFSTTVNWLSIDTVAPTNRTGNGSFRVVASANNGTAERIGYVVVTAPGAPRREVRVTQAPPPAAITLSRSNWDLTSSAASNTNVAVTANRQWTVTSNATSWLTISNISPPDRTGNGSFRMNATANTGTALRSGTITVTMPGTGLTRTIVVTQPPAPAALDLTTSSWSPASGAGNTLVGVTSNRQWSVSSNVTWAFVDGINPQNRTGNGSFRINVQDNTGINANPRSGTITVTVTGAPTRTVSVNQGAPAPILNIPTSSWNTGSHEQRAATVDVASNRQWAVTSNRDWLTIDTIVPASRMGTGSFRMVAAANPDTIQRTGTITVSAPGVPNRTIAVTQPGAPVPSLDLTTNFWSPASAATNVLVGVTSNRPWTVTSNIWWLTISNILPTNQTGNGSFRINATTNTGTDTRTGTITVTTAAPGAITRTITVSQAPPPPVLTLSTDMEGGVWIPTMSTQRSAIVNVTSNRQWSVSSNSAWLTADSFVPLDRTGVGSFRVTAATNPTTATRTGTITVTTAGPGAISRTIAVTQPGQVFVAFGPNGGTGTRVEQMVHVGVFIPTSIVPPNPTRLNHDFVGWYNTDAATGGVRLTNSTTVYANTVFYARWDPHIFRISFDPNGGVGTPSPRDIPFRQPVGSLPPSPHRAGYDFLGWFISRTGGYQLTEETLVTENRTYYAMWASQSPQSFEVTFNPNGAPVVSETRTVQAGTAVGGLPDLTRVGYSLVGWFTQPVGGLQINASRIITADVTFYARWTRQELTVTFDPNGGTTDHPSRSVPAGSTLGWLPTATRGGHVFVGWYRVPGSGIRVTEGTVIDSNVTFYAVWDTRYYTITLDPSGGSVNPTSVTRLWGGEIGTLPTPTKAGYSFIGWYNTFGARVQPTMRINYDMVFFARWGMLTITFNSNGGAALAQPTRTIISGQAIGPVPQAPTRQGASLGHRFDGWFTHPTGGTQITASTIAGDNSITAYARWQCNVALWPTRLNPNRTWYHLNNISLRPLSFTTDHIPPANRAVWENAVVQGASNWSGANSPVNFMFEGGSANVVQTHVLPSGPPRTLGTFQPTSRTNGVVSSFRVRLCPVNIPARVDEDDLDINDLITFVMVHELGHALGLRDGNQRDGHPTIIGGTISASVMNGACQLLV